MERTIVIINAEERVHLPMRLCDQEGILKTRLHTYSLIKPCIITCKVLHDSSVARFPADKLSRAHADY